MASVLLALAPGPDNIFVLTQAGLHGRRAGMFITVGLCTGLLVHTTAVALGVAAIIQASAIAFTTLKAIGAIYLLYLAWNAFRASATQLSQGKTKKLTRIQFYHRGIVMNVTNPKVGLFFLAFLPQFVDPGTGATASQVLLLGVIFIGATLIVFGGIALASATLGAWLRRSPRAQIVMNRMAATIFAGLALKLAMGKRLP